MVRSLFFITIGFLFACDREEGNIVGTAEIAYLQTFGGERNEQAVDLLIDPDGGYWVLAETQSTAVGDINRSGNDYDYWLLKFSASHQLLFQQLLGGNLNDRPSRILSLADNHLLLAGSTSSPPSAGLQDFWLQKLASDGTTIWQHTYGFAGVETAYDALELPNGDIIVVGIIDVTASQGQGNTVDSKSTQKHAGGDYWVLRINANGELLWSNYFGGTNTDTAYAVQTASNGQLLVLGTSDSEDYDVLNNQGSYDGWLTLLGLEGNLLQQANFGGTQIENIRSLVAIPDGGFYVVGDTRSSDGDIAHALGGADIWVLKINTALQIQWEKTFGGPDFESAYDAKISAEGDLVVVGSSRSSIGEFSENKGNNDAFALAIDAQGNVRWQKTWGGSNFDRAYRLVLHPEQGFLIVGATASVDGDISSTQGFNDIFVTHLVP